GREAGEHQAAGGPLRPAQRPLDLPAGRGPPGEPGLRHRPPELRDVQLVLQPDPGPDRPVGQQGPLRAQGLHAAQAAGRGSGAPAPGEDRREADETHPGTGRLHRRAGGGSVQARALPLLTGPAARDRAPRGARFFFEDPLPDEQRFPTGARGWTGVPAPAGPRGRSRRGRRSGGAAGGDARAMDRLATRGSAGGRARRPSGRRRPSTGAGPGPAPAAADPGFAPFRARHQAHQRAMLAATGRLRGRLRDLVAAAPSLVRLAEVDAALEQALAPREHALLGQLPDLVAEHFARLRAQHVPGGPGAWLDRFRLDLRDLLLAELDLRFSPVHALLAALATDQPPP